MKAYKSITKYILLIVLLPFAVFSCKTNELPLAEVTETEKQSILPTVEEQPESLQKDKISEYLSSLSIEDKIGQLIFINAREYVSGKPMIEMNQELEERIKSIRPGGVLFFGGNLKTISQSVKFIEDIQDVSATPLFIASDVEGGAINRLRTNDALHATDLPANILIAEGDSRGKAVLKASVIAKEMFALGINMNFAPVADVLSNPANTVIGNRSFGSDPHKVSELVSLSVETFREHRVASVVKHFPGHGDTIADSHIGAVSVSHNLERLEQSEFLPFVAGIKAGTDGVMTAHIQVPEVTGNDLPATLSPLLMQKILREKLNFQGLVITDSMGMGAISKHWSPGKAALLAVRAGVDIILNPASATEAYAYLIQAHQEGQLQTERIDESVYRIIKSKMELGIMDGMGNYIYHDNFLGDPEAILGSEEHKIISDYLFQN